MSEPMPASLQAPEAAERLASRARLVAIAGTVAALAGALVDRPQFFQSYLVAFIFWTGLSLGCLALMMIHHLSGGGWGLVTRRVFEAAARTIPLMAVLFLPLLVGLPDVYEWARPEAVSADPILQHKQPYLNVPFWIARTLGYFVVWSAMAWLLTRWSSEQDATGPRFDKRFSRLSGPGLVVYALTVSLASIDWMMSVDPHWFSTIYGFLMIGGQGLAALAFTILLFSVLGPLKPLSDVLETRHLHDLGKLMFAFVLLYAYFAFSQFLIIWMANLPEEIPWYIRRMSGGWQALFGLLVLGHFAVPFAILLSARVKRDVRRLRLVAGLLFVMRILDIHFQVAPQFHRTVTLHWIDVAVVVAMGGIWLTGFFHYLKGRPMLPVRDPYFAEVVASHGSH